MHADVVRVQLAASLGPADEPPAEEVRHHGGELLDAGLEVVDHDHRLVGLRPHFFPDSLEARRPGLQVCHADDVLVAHPGGEMPRHRRGDLGIRAAESLQALAIQLGIVGALVVAQPLVGEPHDVGEPRCPLGWRRLLGRLASAARDFIAGGEAAQAGFGAASCLADRRLAGLARDRQHAAAGHGAEEHRIDDGAAFLRELAHVEEHRVLCQLARRRHHLVGFVAAIGHLHLLDRGVDAMRRGDERGALGAHVAIHHGAPGLDQLGGDHDVDVAGTRRERQHRIAAAELAAPRGVDLQVIGRGAGALRDAGNRGGLRRQIALGRGFHQPVGHDATAFAAEGGNQDGDRTLG